MSETTNHCPRCEQYARELEEAKARIVKLEKTGEQFCREFQIWSETPVGEEDLDVLI